MFVENNALPFPVKDLEGYQQDLIARYVSGLPKEERPEIININELYIVYNWIMLKLPSGALNKLGTTSASYILSTSQEDSVGADI